MISHIYVSLFPFSVSSTLMVSIALVDMGFLEGRISWRISRSMGRAMRSSTK